MEEKIPCSTRCYPFSLLSMADTTSSPDSPENRLFLLDGMALVYRAHFALIRSPIFTSGRMNTSAIFGFANTLLELIQNQNPTHLAVAFDTSDPTFRHDVYPEYKANRDAMPEDLSLQIPAVKRLVEAFNIPVIECPGWEADDVIGTLARKADEDGGFETFMVTPDKDFAQLVTERSKIYKPGRQGSAFEILDRAAICENWQVNDPLQTIDILGLWGDASDNIPGVPGIGEKTAKKLIAQFGSMEKLLDSTDQLKGKQKENVENNREQALLSKQLVTIIKEAPTTVSFDDLKITAPNDEAVRNILSEFELNSLGRRLYGNDFKAGRSQGEAAVESGTKKLKTITDCKKNYQAVAAADSAARSRLIEELSREKSFCFDLETDSLDHKTCSIIGIAFSTAADQGSYVEVPKGAAGKEILAEMAPLFTESDAEKIGHNLKFDIGVLHWNGIRTKGPVFDTMLAHALIEPDQRHKMDYLSESLLGYTPITYEEVFGDGTEKTGQMNLFAETEISDGPDLEAIAQYAAEDADVTWQLAQIFREKLKEAKQDSVFHEIECPLVSVLVDMEAEGIRVDPATLGEIGVALEKQIEEHQKAVFTAAGQPEFNIKSPKQVGEVLFDRLKLVEKPKKTKTGQYKTDEQTLSALAGEHQIVRDLLDFREAAKLKSTYVDALPKAIFPGTSRIHTTFLQLMTATGRLASNHPNLQNIPIRSAQGREIRKAFVPRSDEYILMAADYSQIELRVMASLCQDPAMMEAFESDIDIHTATASRVFGVGIDDVVPDMRRTAKMVNFGIIYGISAFGLSQRLGGSVSRTEASEIIEEYFRQYTGVKTFQEQTIEEAVKNGYVETMTGRRRYLRDIDSRNGMIRSAAERTAINTPIQGSAADMIKIAMTKVANLLDEGNYQTKMLLQVHDELVFDLHRDEERELTPKIVEAMESALPLRVPVLVETGTGENWLAAH